MLKTITITHLSDKKNILQSFEPKNSVWITSDIKSQLFILNHLEKRKKPAWTNSVFRAQDFWITLLHKIDPNITVASRTTLCLIYQQWISESQGITWQKTKETGYILCEFISMMAHIHQHPNQDSLLKEWWSSKKKNINLHWNKWYTLSQSFYSYLMEKKIIETSWVDTYLLDKNIHLPQWKELIVDIGSDINPVESELISQLSTKNQVTVLIPLSYKDKTWQCAFTPYRSLVKTPKIESPPPKTPLVSVKKFSSMLAEIKDITAQVKKILKTLKPSQVSILAPNIEDYWPCLKSHLLMEEIPFKKSETTALISFPVIQLWLANMWTHLGVIEYENLETILYSKPKPLYSPTYFQANHLHTRHIKDVPPYLLNKEWLRDKHTVVSSTVFTQWAKKLLPQKKSSILQKIKTELLELNILKNIQLPFESWLTLLNSHLRQQEIPITDEKQEGIHCLSTNALAWVDSDFIYLAGLSEQNLKTDKHYFISSMEADIINEDLGFIIKTQASDKLEQNIMQFIQQEHKNLILSFSASNFHGEPFNPSALWLEQAQKYTEDVQSFHQPEFTVWDKQQKKNDIKDILSKRALSESRIQLIEQSIAEDKGLRPIKTFFTKDQNELEQIKNLSSSSFENYIRCPFIFASKKLFKLRDDHQKDVDMDSAEKGSLIHKLFEQIKKLSLQNPTISDQDILQKIKHFPEQYKFPEQEKYKKIVNTIHPVVWKKEKNYLLEKAKLFLKNERKLKKIFKNLQFNAAELKYNCFWNQKKAGLDKQGDMEIKGSIDRIDKDTDKNTYFIIDYKKTLPTGGAVTGWSQQNNFQLGLYMQAVELGLTELPPHIVEQALYLSYKDFSWVGYAEKNPNNTQLFNSSRSRSLISKEKKQQVLNEINAKMNTLIAEIKSGNFTPKPFKESYCSKCRWSKICRATHLN